MRIPSSRGHSPVYHPAYKYLLAKLVAARREAGLTQAEVADAMGRPRSQIGRCENGERRIDPVDLQEFAILYGKPVTYFLAPDSDVLKANKALKDSPYRKSSAST